MLVTASDRRLAEAVATHLGLFDEVIASDGVRNIKGKAKAEALERRFGVKGFVYAGNARADLAVWRKAQAAILVNVPNVGRAQSPRAARRSPPRCRAAAAASPPWCTSCASINGSRTSWCSWHR